MKVAAYQAPLSACRSAGLLALIREQVNRCESEGVRVLCCPEGILGGLADYAAQPTAIAIDPRGGRLNDVLAPLASDAVTTVLGFTETDAAGRLFNAAAVFHRGSVAGVYRKLHPAINRSVYEAGLEMPVFTIGDMTFGILICRDSTFVDPARAMASQGATVLFVPTNNGLPAGRTDAAIVDEARKTDIVQARENGVFVVRADVAGRTRDLVSYGSSGIVGPDGTVLASAAPLRADLVVADLDFRPYLSPPSLRLRPSPFVLPP